MMKISLSSMKISRTAFAKWLLCGCFGFAGAWIAFGIAISGVARTKNPSLALQFRPTESSALASLADRRYFANDATPSPEARALALKALTAQSINPRAIRILGYFAAAEHQNERAELLIKLAERLSRREPGTQLWLIDNSVRKGDVKQVLAHYDTLLRTQPEMQEQLFPRLMLVLIDPNIRSAMRPYIRQRYGWANDFLRFANGKSTNLPALVNLVVESGGLVDKQQSYDQKISLLARLYQERDFANAKKLYLTMPGATDELLTDIKFTSTDVSGKYGPMGWETQNSANAGGAFIAGKNQGLPALNIFADAGTTTPVATRLAYLSPGHYEIKAVFDELKLGSGGFLKWRVRCPSTGTEIQTTASKTANAINAQFEINASCYPQLFDILLSGGGEQIGSEGYVTAVTLAHK